jgi:hypothetical protein
MYHDSGGGFPHCPHGLIDQNESPEISQHAPPQPPFSPAVRRKMVLVLPLLIFPPHPSLSWPILETEALGAV